MPMFCPTPPACTISRIRIPAIIRTAPPVPFYQMVVHGCVDYSSLAGNLSYNDAYQKLRWVETGSIPHFLITHENPIRLKETSYNRIFSSQYTAWKEAMTAVYQEFNQRLSGVWNQTIERHDRLSADVVRLTYGDGAARTSTTATAPPRRTGRPSRLWTTS